MEKLQNLEYDTINISERICHYWYFLGKGFQYEPNVYNGSNELMEKANFNDITIASVK